MKSAPAGGAEPRPYNLPRKKVTFIKSLIAPSIDGRYSKATSYKSDTPISGGAYQDTRKVITEWNARLKHRGSPEFRCRMPPRIPTHSFLPHLFSCERKDGAAGGVGSRKSAKTSQALRASIPTPFVPSGHFPPDRGNRPLIVGIAFVRGVSPRLFRVRGGRRQRRSGG